MNGEIVPRAGDGRICRRDAAALAKVDPDTISQWIHRGHLTDVKREGRQLWLMPAEVIEVHWKLSERERKRDARRFGALEPALREPVDPAEFIAQYDDPALSGWTQQPVIPRILRRLTGRRASREDVPA